ncbi:MAG: hypothetical protein IJ072_01405 [Oscillospiraceae bacterium]|nr:hypothetical protein [Oscillospiraceae bacterium]
MINVYFCCDDFVTAAEKKFIRCGIETVSSLLPAVTPVNLSSLPWAKDSSLCGQTFLQGCNRENGQLDASKIIKKLIEGQRLLPSPGKTMLITASDLTMGSMSYCFGAGRISGDGAVISVSRFRALSPAQEKHCVIRTMCHELGHMLGMASDSARKNTSVLHGTHCTVRRCFMRQTPNLTALLNTAGERECYCPLCLEDMKRNFSANP